MTKQRPNREHQTTRLRRRRERPTNATNERRPNAQITNQQPTPPPQKTTDATRAACGNEFADKGDDNEELDARMKDPNERRQHERQSRQLSERRLKACYAKTTASGTSPKNTLLFNHWPEFKLELEAIRQPLGRHSLRPRIEHRGKSIQSKRRY